MCLEHGFRLEAGEVAKVLREFLDRRDVVPGSRGEESAVEVNEGGVILAGGTKVK